MHKSALYLFLVVLIILCLPTVLPLLRHGYYYSHDGIVHAARFSKFHDALADGQFPPRWANGVAFGLGSPAIMFYGFLPYLSAEIPYLITNSYTQSLEVIFGLSLILSALTFFLWSRKITKNNFAALVGAVIYCWAPYRMVDVYVRGAFPESFLFIFPPLLFWSAQKILKEQSLSGLVVTTLSIAALILSHTILALAFIGLYFVYVIFFLENRRKTLLLLIFSIIFGFAISAFSWFPAFFESHNIHSEILSQLAIYKSNFVPLIRLIYTRWGWGVVNSNNSLATNIGMPQLVILTLIFYLVIKQRKKFLKLKTILFFLTTTIFFLFLVTNYSAFLWDKIYLLQLFVYPWRFLSVVCFTLATLSSLTLINFSKAKLIGISLIFLAIIAGRNSLQVASFYSDSNDLYKNFRGTTDIAGEFLPKDANLNKIMNCYTATCSFPLIEGLTNYEYKIQSKKSNQLIFSTHLTNFQQVTINTLYFRGWKILDGNQLTNVDINSLGTMSINIPPGKHLVKVEFKETPIWILSDLISLLGLCLLTVSIIFYYFFRRSSQKSFS